MATSPAHPFEHREALLDEWVAVRREIARLEAKASGLLAQRMQLCNQDANEHPFSRESIYRSMLAEYSAAGRISKGTIEYAFNDASTVSEYFPTVAESFAAGDISAAHVREIVRAARAVQHAFGSGTVSSEIFALYEAAVLVVAETDTPARTRAHARQVAATLAFETVKERHESAAIERSVTLRSLDDGLALLSVVLPETLGVAIYDRLTRMTTQIMRNRTEDRRARSGNSDSDSDSDSDVGVVAGVGEVAESVEWAQGEDVLEVPELPESLREEFTEELAEHLVSIAGYDLPRIYDDADPTVPDTIPDWVLDGYYATTPGADEPISGETGNSETSTGKAGTGETVTNCTPRDTRTYDQIRTDLLVDLLLASDASAALGKGLDSIQAHIQVTVTATTLAGIDDKLAQLDGHGPLHPEIARDLASRNGGWTKLFLTPGGMVTETDTYSPTDSMKRYLRARDQHCRFPGCGVSATRCDIDHNQDHAKGGKTRLVNRTGFGSAFYAGVVTPAWVS
jgi:hypothetical protein